jgi:hypothetical protein
MAAINLFRGGSTPLAGMGADCACGPFPSTYPAPARVANHLRDQRFTMAAQLDPEVNPNIQCVLCDLAPDGTAQTANVINQKIGLLRVPAKHLLQAVRMILDPGNGVGATFTVYADRVNPTTGAVVSGITLPTEATGNTLAAARDEVYFLPTSTAVAASGNAETLAIPTAGGIWTDNDVVELGVIFTAGPTTGTLCSWTGSITLVAKVDGFDYGAN